ncbi:Rep protein, partial [Escherichia coli]|nr:Rep protein [Escherichia coli]
WPAFTTWREAVIQRVEMYNASLPVPLSLSECRAIGKSIAKYTHRKFTPETFAQYVNDTHTPEIQDGRGRKGSSKSKRRTVATAARTLKPCEALGISRAWYYQPKKRGIVEQT